MIFDDNRFCSDTNEKEWFRLPLSNHAYLMEYLRLFHALASEENEQAAGLWQRIRQYEGNADENELGALRLKRAFALSELDFLLVMAALALEIDAELRTMAQKGYHLKYPCLEYGLHLIAPLCPVDSNTLGQLASQNKVCDLLLVPEPNLPYSLFRPLVLCRAAFVCLSASEVSTELAGMIRFCKDEKKEWFAIHRAQRPLVQAWWEKCQTRPRCLYLYGGIGSGRRSLLMQVCGGFLWGQAIWTLSGREQQQFMREISVLSILEKLPVAIPATESNDKFQVAEVFFSAWNVPLVVIADDERQLLFAQEVVRFAPVLPAAERDIAAAALLGEAAQQVCISGDISIGSMVQTIHMAKELAGQRLPTQADVQKAMMLRASRTPYGIEYHPDIDLSDLVVPEEVTNQLRLICAAGENSARLREWGIPRVREGVTAVFHGPPGTGKTMAASAIAKELNMPLLRVDLSQIMDKYVGETEKHLAALLTNAKENQCVLLFDEADSLFGKRTAMDTGHDKYANLTVSFLLQEMDNYHGVALLSTNLLQNFDAAFFRRLNYIVHFPLPDFPLRLTLWDVAFPKNKREEGLPLELFAQLELSPACIFAIARGAAVCAMSHGRKVFTLFDVQQATRLELEKQGKIIPGFLENVAPL